MKKRLLAGVLALVMIMMMLPAMALADGTPNVAEVAGTEYQTLDEAVAAAKDGDTIEVLKDCETVNGFGISAKKLTVHGNGNTITANTKGIYVVKVENKIGELIFDDCTIELKPAAGTPTVNGEGYGWAATVVNYDCVLSFQNCFVTAEPAGTVQTGFYYHEGSKINLENTTMTVNGFSVNGFNADVVDQGTPYTSELNVRNNSNLTVTNCKGGIIAAMQITVENSKLTVSKNRGNASNGADYYLYGATVEASENGYHGMSARSITIASNDGKTSNVTCNGNGMYGITAYGTVSIKDGSNVTANENAQRKSGAGIRFAKKGTTATIESGATITIDKNNRNGLENYGSCTFEEGAKLEVLLNNETNNGGGIYNAGTLVLPSDAVIYNNHAGKAGDDIYNAEGASIAFAKVGSGWVLDDCDHTIDGWYDDAEGQRWSVHAEQEHVEEFARTESAETVEAPLALKAAHDLNPEDPLPTLLAGLWLNTNDHYSYLIGYADGTVRPNGKITRAEVATIFFRLLDDDTRAKYWSSENNFSDVSADKWYNNAVSTLCNMGVIGGYADGTFRPDAPISRAEFAKIAVSFTQNNGSTTYNYFTDVKTTDWFAPYVTAAKDAGLIEGYSDGSFKPESKITRAEACAIVNRTLGRKPSKAHMKISDRIDWPDVQTTDWFYEAIMEATNSHTYQMGKRVETWNDKLPQRDWAALETGWANAYTGNGGEVR